MAYKRQIAYFDLLEKGLKKGNTGFCKWEYQNGRHTIRIFVKGLNGAESERTGVYTKAGTCLGELIMKNGRTEAVYHMEDSQRDWSRELDVVRIPLSRGCELEAKFQEEKKADTFMADTMEQFSDNPKTPEKQEVLEKPEEADEQELILEEEVTPSEEEKESVCRLQQSHFLNLWDSLATTNDTIRPFGTETEYYRIALEDIYKLKEEYHVLRNNQFLLHGYYNYHYLILGKKMNEEEKYWLGVPGIYHEREKMAARMYGFEKFEGAKRNYSVGDLGYYLISAE